MTDSVEQLKKCPDCGQTLKAEAAICRHCGYIFPFGKAARTGSRGLTQELATQSATAGRVSIWLKLLWPVLVAVVLCLLVFGTFYASQHTSTWEYAQRSLPAAKSYDSGFEEFIIAAYREDGLTAEVRACDGICLINVATKTPHGILSRLGTKLGAFAIGCSYAALRQRHGDDPVATVTIFTNGRRSASATCDGQKHPEFLK